MATQNLYEFLQDKTNALTENWYEKLDKTKSGVYGSTDSNVIAKLKEQNHEFHIRFTSIFDGDYEEGLGKFQDWIFEIGKDPGHLSTPLTDILEEFFILRSNIWDSFMNLHCKIRIGSIFRLMPLFATA